MGGRGVDIRARSIRITFTFKGKQERKTLYLNGEVLAPTPANIRYAERLAAEIREKVRLGIFSMRDYFPDEVEDASGITVLGQLDKFLKSSRIEKSTKSGYTSAARFWIPMIGSRSIRGLKHSDIMQVISAHPHLSGKTINNYVSVLKDAMAMAVLDGDIIKNPVTEVPRAAYQKPKPDPFTSDETERIIDRMREVFPGQVHNMVEFWFWTGMRTSEIHGLQWANVDLNSDTVLVTEALVRGVRKARTKTAVSRLVRLNSRARQAIERQRSLTQLQGGAVFFNPRTQAAWNDEHSLRRPHWTPVLKALGIRYRRPYNMRHTYATTMLMAGMAPAFCARQLGHSVEVFLNTYAKWIDGQQDDFEMQRLEIGIGDKTGIKSANQRQ